MKIFISDDGTRKTISYPRLLMEEKLGRPLTDDEDVHHIDGNKQNNSIDNLELVSRKYHAELHKMYRDKLTTCEICGRPFVWSENTQKWYNSDLKRRNRAISCSRSCSSKYGMFHELPYKHDKEQPVYDNNGRMIISFNPKDYY